jgi:hypothetical protein
MSTETDRSTTKQAIVIAGLPRSGTTWTMRALGTSPGVTRLNEPDNEDKFPAAIHAKHHLGRYPSLVPGQQARSYRNLWLWILDGAREGRREQWARKILGPGAANRIFEGDLDLTTRLAATLARDPKPKGNPTRVVAKSIHAQLSIEWIAAEFPITPLILLRHPANVLASWMDLRLKDGRNSTLESRPEVQARYTERWDVPPPSDDPVEKMCWRIGLLIAALEEALAHNPTWHMRTHEQLCTDSVATFRTLFDDLGLEWSDATEKFLVDNDTPGEGFETQRVAADLSESWKRRLDDAQLATLRRVLGWFPITTWSDADFERTGS